MKGDTGRLTLSRVKDDLSWQDQISGDARRWGFDKAQPHSLFPAATLFPSNCGWAAELGFGAAQRGYKPKTYHLIVDMASEVSWIASLAKTDGKENKLYDSYIPTKTRNGVVLEGVFTVDYVGGFNVTGDNCRDFIFMSRQFMGTGQFGVVRNGSLELMDLGKNIFGVLGLSMQSLHKNSTSDIVQSGTSNMLANMFKQSRSHVEYSIDLANKDFIFHDQSSDPNSWCSVDIRGRGLWALTLRMIKWCIPNKSIESCDINAPLVFDIGTRFCYFGDSFLNHIYRTIDGQKLACGWAVPLSSSLPEQIELVFNKSGTSEPGETISIFLPGSVLRNVVLPDGLSLSAFQSGIINDVNILGSIALENIKTYYKYQFEHSKMFMSMVVGGCSSTDANAPNHYIPNFSDINLPPVL